MLKETIGLSEFIRVGIDTGGTFTDFVVARGTRLTSFKVSSTPHNPAQAILEGLARVIAESGAPPTEIVHGTTVATNALLERKGARTALVTTAGFEDVIEIGRQARPELYNLMVTRPAPLVARQLRFGLNERTGPNAEILTPLDAASLEETISKIHHASPPVESVAVCLLFSFANPAHEQIVARALEAFSIPVSLSHKILPEYREYERTSTTVINAYLVPIMSRYLRSLISGLGVGGQGPGAGVAACARFVIVITHPAFSSFIGSGFGSSPAPGHRPPVPVLISTARLCAVRPSLSAIAAIASAWRITASRE